MRKLLFTLLITALSVVTADAQRKTDALDRGLVAVKVSNGVFVSWRQQADEYYDVTYNLYRNGTKVNATPLSVTNYTDANGTTSSTYTVKAVVKGIEQEASAAKSVWANDYLEITPQHPSDIHSTLVPNDACAADVDGDGQLEILLKYDNQSEVNNAMQRNGWYGEHTIFEVLELDGTVKWWVNCGPNMGDFQNNEQNIVGYDWDQDGKAEVVMRLEEGSTIHMADGTTYQIGADGQNGTAWTNYREPRYLSYNASTVALAFNLPSNASVSVADHYYTTKYENKTTVTTEVDESATSWLSTSIQNGVLYVTTTANETTGDGSHATGRYTSVYVNDGTETTEYSVFQLEQNTKSVEWFTHYGKEFLVYCNGETGEIYDIIDFPCARFESDETDLNAAWGDGYGHRSSKYFYGAPYLDGRNPSIFVGRGIYTRHKFVALDVDKNTHKLSERWRWMNNQKGSPWYGQGYHNYAIVDVDWDGRDEIVWGSMVIDDNGMGLSTTGLGHGDSQHHGDLNPYVHGQEGFFCNEDNPGNNYRDLTTGQIYYRNISTNDDGRAIAGNFSNEIPGSIASSAHDSSTPISLVAGKHVDDGYTTAGMNQNFNCYWDGDLCEETFNYVNGKNTEGAIAKFGSWTPIKTLTGSMTNNDTKGTPCFMGDILGDWRHEFIMRTADNHIRVYTTTIETPWSIYSLWYDHQQRNAMVWQMCGYNQPPHTSYFLGEMEGITAAPPAFTMTGRTEIANGGTINTTDNTIISCETNDMTINVTDGASPYIYIDNAPSWVQGSAPSEATSKDYNITYKYYTHTLTGGAFTGDTRLVKQGDGMLVLPNVNQTYSGATEVWAGSLAFSGTMPNSEVWMNRHTNLYTAGTFTQPVTMEYGSKLYICKDNATGDGSLPEAEYTSANFKTLNLHEGARIIMNIDPENNKADALNVGTLSLRTQDWEYGPKYLNPVIEINSPSKIPAGTYLLGDVSNVNGNVNFTIEGNNFSIYSNKEITVQNGHLYLNVTDDAELEEPTNNAAINNTKDIIQTWDFMSISATEFNKNSSWLSIGEEETTVANITCKNSTTEGTEGLVFDVTKDDNIWRIVKEGLRNQGTSTRTLGITNLAKNDVITVVCSVYGTDNTVVSVNTGNAVTSVADHTYTFTMTEDGTLGLNVTRTANGNYYTIEKITRAPGYSKLTLSPTAVTDYEQAVYDSVIVAREFNAGYSTLCVPFNTTVSEFTNGDTEAYVAYLSDVKVDNGVTTLVFSNTTEIKANTPYILYLSKVLSTPTFIEKPVFLSDTRVFHSNSWTMYGNYTPGFSMYGKYGVARNAAIMKGGSASTLNAYGAYLTGPSNAAGAKIVFGELVEDDDATGISVITDESTTQRNGKYADNQQIIILHNGKRYKVNGALIK